MKNNQLKLFLVIGIIISAVACTNRDIIPERDMVRILTKVYLTDATVNSMARTGRFNNDSTQYYEHIIEGFGYTTDQFDSSIKYYSYHTDKFDDIYDRVIIELAKIEASLSDNAQSKTSTDKSEQDTLKNLWPLKSYWNMAVENNPHLGFDVEIKGLGSYVLTYDALIFPDDGTVDPFFDAFLHCGTADEVVGQAVGHQTYYYEKGPEKHSHSFTFEVNDEKLTILRGYLYLYDRQQTPQNASKRAIFTNIVVRYIPAKPAVLHPAVEKKPTLKRIEQIKLIDERQ